LISSGVFLPWVDEEIHTFNFTQLKGFGLVGLGVILILSWILPEEVRGLCRNVVISVGTFG
jgi:hypothetical protein